MKYIFFNKSNMATVTSLKPWFNPKTHRKIGIDWNIFRGKVGARRPLKSSLKESIDLISLNKCGKKYKIIPYEGV